MAAQKDRFPYEEARLSKPKTLPDGSEDLTKQWVVDYRVWSEQREQLVRKRITLTSPTARERLAEADSYIAQINKWLKKGVIAEKVPLIERTKKAVDSGAIGRHSSLDDALSYFQKFKNSTLKKQSKRTYESCERKLRGYLTTAKLRNIRLHLFTVAHALAYLDDLKLNKKLSNRTYNKHRGYCHTLFEFYISRKILTENPFGDIDKLKVSSGQHIPFMPAQVKAIKKYFDQNPDPQLWLFINFIYYTFSRPHEELRNLRVRNVMKRSLLIVGEDAKDSATNPKPIAPGLELLIQQEAIREAAPHFYVFGPKGKPGPTPMGETYFYKKHRTILQAVGLPTVGYDLYGWKHTGVIALYMATKDMKLIQSMCGHEDIQTTDQYLRDLGLFLRDDQVDGFPAL